jgi:hypothetical protein
LPSAAHGAPGKEQVGTKRWSHRSNKEVIKRKNTMSNFARSAP